MSYKQLTQNQRYVISVLNKRDHTQKEIANENQFALINAIATPEQVARYYTDFHANDKFEHRDYIIQLTVQGSPVTPANFGATKAPASMVLYRDTSDKARLSTAVHEVGHSLTQQPTGTYHSTHSQGFNDEESCVAFGPIEEEPTAIAFCPFHVRELRSHNNRSWTVDHTKKDDSK